MARMRTGLLAAGCALCLFILIFQHEYAVLLQAPASSDGLVLAGVNAMMQQQRESELSQPSLPQTPAPRSKDPFEDLYGPTPLIIGLDRCANMPLAVTGLFNTGTNLLAQLLKKNCFVRQGSRETPALWQVPWGKHRPLSSRGVFYVKAQQGADISHIMPVMVARDPLTWMRSMCRNPYAARLRPRLNARNCSRFTVRHPLSVTHPDMVEQYADMVEYWSKWNGLHLRSNISRLIVRFEDLAYNQEATVRQICKCVGGFVPDQFRLEDRSVKAGVRGHGASPASSRATLITQLLDASYRERPYSPEDKEFFNRRVDAEVMRAFHYKFVESS